MVRASDVVLVLVAIIFPPAAAGFVAGCGCDLLINICLTILGYLPGHIHAFWLIYRKMQAEERYGSGGYQCALTSDGRVRRGLVPYEDADLPSDIGSGSYEPLGQATPPSAQNYNYGATSNR